MTKFLRFRLYVKIKSMQKTSYVDACVHVLRALPYHAITEHSMCHPGLPGPHGLGHAGSPCLLAFHNAKSLLCRFS